MWYVKYNKKKRYKFCTALIVYGKDLSYFRI